MLFNHISPLLIFSSPAIALRIVVLPTPDGPRIEIISPWLEILNDTSTNL